MKQKRYLKESEIQANRKSSPIDKNWFRTNSFDEIKSTVGSFYETNNDLILGTIHIVKENKPNLNVDRYIPSNEAQLKMRIFNRNLLINTFEEDIEQRGDIERTNSSRPKHQVSEFYPEEDSSNRKVSTPGSDVVVFYIKVRRLPFSYTIPTRCVINNGEKRLLTKRLKYV